MSSRDRFEETYNKLSHRFAPLPRIEKFSTFLGSMGLIYAIFAFALGLLPPMSILLGLPGIGLAFLARRYNPTKLFPVIVGLASMGIITNLMVMFLMVVGVVPSFNELLN